MAHQRDARRATWGDAWPLPPLELRLVFLLAAVKLAVHLATANRYGYFRDELYFLDLGRHLDWGYVDCAPLIALYAKVALLLGGSLPVLRGIAAVAGAASVALTMVLARELGGGRFAQLFAGLCVLAAPIFLAENSLMTMNAFEILFWMGCVWALIRVVRTGDSRWWIAFGVIAGLGLENKHSTLLFGAAVAVALLLSRERRELAKPWIWIGGAIALLLFLPNLLWQVRHHFPTLEDLENVKRSGKNVVLSPVQFVKEQVLFLHPLLLPVWLAGLVSLLVGRLSRMRVLGWTYLALLALMIAGKAKNYYLAPIYPMLFAAGAVATETWLDRRGWTRAAGGRGPRSRRSSSRPARASLRRSSRSSRPRSSSPISAGSAPRPRRRRSATRALSSSASAISSAGRSSPPTSPGSTARFRPTSARRPASSRATTARPERSTSSAPRSACRPRSAPTRTTTSGARRPPSPRT